MDASRFDRMSKLFAKRKLSRRRALATSAGIAAASLATARAPTRAQDASPEATTEEEPSRGDKTVFLFVQSFQGGSITPAEDQDGRYTVTLDQGTGQTIYFSDRPDRIVGSTPTPRFLEGLGFPEDNPPNAALIVETAPGETDIAVVELFNPTHDPTTQGVTYEVEVLANWQQSLTMDFSEAPTDLAEIAPTFGSAQLFIDDCPDWPIGCYLLGEFVGHVGSILHDHCWSWTIGWCVPCLPKDAITFKEIWDYWGVQCDRSLPACNGACTARSTWS